MNNASAKSRVPISPEQEEDQYFRDSDTSVSVAVEHFEKDVICSLCGLWKSEHRWEICKEPNWL